MAFDQTTRNRLQKFVAQARDLLTREFTRQLQNDYGMDPDAGTLSDIDRLTHLDDTRYQTAILLRETLVHYQASSPGSRTKEILSRIVREQAFTVLNRLCALRMAEARGIVMESIAQGYKSKGFQLYERVAGSCFGTTGDAFRNYLFSVFDEFALDLAVLFDRYSPMGRLFPRESVLLELMDLINEAALDTLWVEDETIGWIYQYFNSAEERKKMRAESQAPRNSRELAVRNQFFTPRYVVEFLTDNTLGRIWYEMTQGKTALKDQCRYLVRRPNEIFLSQGDALPEQAEPHADLTQEELLQLPVYIEHRPLKDPREILMLDPACGSMHFGLYAFDLFEKIYEEAWDLQAFGQWQGEKSKKFRLLTETYPTREAFQTDIPRLIIENNIHGIDIDPRAVQIAGLSLWLRAQRSWKKKQVPPGQRPEIRKAHIVCAEPMPGETEMLTAFSETLKPRVLGQLVEIIFEKMSLAGEAGSLLKIEEEIEEAIGNAREAFNQELVRRKDEAGYLPGMAPKVRQRELFDFADLPDKTQFWETAEEKILEALKGYAEQAEEENVNRRRLFSEDAAKGFAFIDLCRKRYDVVLMNPPFGTPTNKTEQMIKECYSNANNNLLCSFIYRNNIFISPKGFIGCITDRTWLQKTTYDKFRIDALSIGPFLNCLIDLDWGVLDGAQVATCLAIFQNVKSKFLLSIDLREKNKQDFEKSLIRALKKDLVVTDRNTFVNFPDFSISHWCPSTIKNLFIDGIQIDPQYAFSKRGISAGDTTRAFRLEWEVPYSLKGFYNRWAYLQNGGAYSPYYRDTYLVVWYQNNYKILSPLRGARLQNLGYVGKIGLTWSKRTDFLSPSVLPEKHCFTDEGQGLFAEESILWSLLSLLNSKPYQYIINLFCGQHKSNGYVAKLPILHSFIEKSDFKSFAVIAYNQAKQISVRCEPNTLFVTPFRTILKQGDSLSELCNREFFEDTKQSNKIKSIQEQIDDLVYQYLELTAFEKNIVEKATDSRTNCTFGVYNNLSSEYAEYQVESIHLIFSYFIGVIYGRWDMLYFLGKKFATSTHLPFAFLPICPPGMLQNADGLPAEPKDVPNDYPLRITWSGIILDDEGHPEDIITRVREAMEVFWKDRANDIEQEACEILGVDALRDYFSKPGKFFADHLKRYSKSRRQAPIYWPLSTPSGSYTLWLYYHRLSDQILYTCVNNFVSPKLKQVSEEAAALQKKTGRTRQEEKDLETLTNLAAELSEFQEDLLRIAAFWKPDLNDGVQITAAPLWKLFQHKPWQTKLKQTWKDLEKGKYDWAHLAYSIWPDRIIRASHKDRSYAIAHDLEEYLWEEIETGTDRQGNVKTQWVPKELSEKQLKAIIQEKTAQPGH